jgi:hypothetical protein
MPEKTRRVPDGWVPSEKTLAWARALHFTPAEIDNQFHQMRDHEFARARLDWDATFKNWLRKEEYSRARHEKRSPHPEPGARRAPLVPYPKPVEMTQEERSRLEASYRRKPAPHPTMSPKTREALELFARLGGRPT